MFAILKTGGKQYKVTSGDVVKVEKLAANQGQTVQFNEIMMISGKETVIGSPLVEGAAVQACLLYTSPSPRDQRGSRMPSSA